MRKRDPEKYQMIERALDQYWDEYGGTPSLPQLSDILSIPHATLHRYLQEMEQMGLVEIDGRRSIRTRRFLKTVSSSTLVPVVGEIACGTPILAEQNIESYVPMSTELFGGGDCYLLKASGDSMIGTGIDDGDLVLIRRQSTAESGQIIVALVNDEAATLKFYHPNHSANTVDLVPANDAYQTRTIHLDQEHFAIQGIAVKVIKNLENKILQ